MKFEEEQKSNPFNSKLSKCANLQNHLEACLKSNPPSDPKCLLLHQVRKKRANSRGRGRR